MTGVLIWNSQGLNLAASEKVPSDVENAKWIKMVSTCKQDLTLGQAARGTGKLRIAEPTKPAFKNPHRLDCRAFVGFICFKEQTNWTFWFHVSVYKKNLQVVEKLSPKPRSLLASGTPETKIHQSLVRKTWCVFSLMGGWDGIGFPVVSPQSSDSTELHTVAWPQRFHPRISSWASRLRAVTFPYFPKVLYRTLSHSCYHTKPKQQEQRYGSPVLKTSVEWYN